MTLKQKASFWAVAAFVIASASPAGLPERFNVVAVTVSAQTPAAQSSQPASPAPATAEPSQPAAPAQAQPAQQQDTARDQVDVNVNPPQSGMWYRSPMWIAIGAVALVLFAVIIIMMAKGSNTTVVRHEH